MSLAAEVQVLTMEPDPLHSAMGPQVSEINGQYLKISTIKQLKEELDRIYAKGSTWTTMKQVSNYCRNVGGCHSLLLLFLLLIAS